MKDEPLISSNLECSKLVMDAMSYLMLKDNPGGVANPSDGNYEVAPAVVEIKCRVPAGVEKVRPNRMAESVRIILLIHVWNYKNKNAFWAFYTFQMFLANFS